MNKILDSVSGSTGNQVYLKLKEQIVNLELPPGTTLSEKEMSVAFQVSRTPVRESFVRLAQEGLVLVLPQKSTRVSLIDPAMVEEARFVREQLERAVVRLACQHFPEACLAELEQNLKAQKDSLDRNDDHAMFKLDEAFHRTIFEGCSKLGTLGVIQQMNAHLNRSRILWLKSYPGWDNLYAHHQGITEAIRRKDADEADRLMNEHLMLTISNLGLLQEKYPDYFS